MQRASALVAAVFGLATVVAGARVLLGGDAGYAVVRPVLLFNTAMGVVYLIAAWVILRDLAGGRRLAVLIAVLNAAVLAAVLVVRATGGVVANETLMAMTLRTVVWAAIAVTLGWRLSRGREAGAIG